MLWRDFAPYVLPHVIGCAMPTLEQHARQVSIDWCRGTLCHQIDLDPELASGTRNAIDLASPSVQLTVVKLMSVAVDGKDRALVAPRVGQQFVRSNHPGDFCFTTDNRTLMVYPLAPAGVEVVATVAMMPSLNANILDDIVGADYAMDIAEGIIASLQRLPNQEFSNPNL